MSKLKITPRAARVNCGLTAKKVSEELGIAEQTVRLWERNPKVIKKIYREKMCEMYGLPESNIEFSGTSKR